MPTSPEHMNRYPIYIISKGRYDVGTTWGALDKLGLPYKVAVETHEYDKYCEYLGEDKVLEMPFSNHGKGSGPARNWCWEHAISQNSGRHWLLDDNIMEFRRFYKNRRVRVSTGAIFRAAEDFVDRYENVPLAGFQYSFFAVEQHKQPPFILNTRIMSCLLIENSCPHRWRAKYNEDVDLSLRVLKDGKCTILFYAFLQDKMRTGQMKGGNTQELYGAGTYDKSKMLVNLHPDCVSLVKRYGRWHHHVDMSRFRKNALILKKDCGIMNEPNNYGMVLVHKDEDGTKTPIKDL